MLHELKMRPSEADFHYGSSSFAQEISKSRIGYEGGAEAAAQEVKEQISSESSDELIPDDNKGLAQDMEMVMDQEGAFNVQDRAREIMN